MKISPKLLVAGLFVAGLAMAGLGYTNWQRSIAAARARVADPRYPLEPLLSTLRGLWFPPADLQAAIDKRLKFELASFRQPIERAVRPEEFRAVDRVLALLGAACGPAQAKQLETLRAYRVEREEQVEYQALDNLVARARPYGDAARGFVKKYPASRRLAQVQTWLHRADQAAEAKDRADLEAMKVATKAEAEAKVAEMEKFLAKYPLAADATERRRAVELARRLLTTTSVKVVVGTAGRFNSAREFSVKVQVEGQPVAEVLSDGDQQEQAFDREVSFAWTPGQSITLILYDYRFGNEEAARVTLPGAWALRALDARRELEPVGSWESYLEGKPFVACHTPDFTDQDWALLDAFFPTADF